MANDQVLFTWLSLSIFLSRDFEKMIGFFGKFSHSSSCETNVWVSQQWVCSMNQIVTMNNVLYSLTYKNNTLKSPKRQFYRWLSGFSQACVLWSRLNIRISCHGCLERKMEETHLWQLSMRWHWHYGWVHTSWKFFMFAPYSTVDTFVTEM